MCCLFALSIFRFNVLHYIFFSFSFFCVYFLERKTEKRKDKERNKVNTPSILLFNVLHYIIIFIFFYFLERKTNKRKEKERNENIES